MAIEVKPDQIWRHRNGNLYMVVCITNQPDEEKYPKTVVYQNISNLTIWSRKFSDWDRSFTYEREVDYFETIPEEYHN